MAYPQAKIFGTGLREITQADYQILRVEFEQIKYLIGIEIVIDNANIFHNLYLLPARHEKFLFDLWTESQFPFSTYTTTITDSF